MQIFRTIKNNQDWTECPEGCERGEATTNPFPEFADGMSIRLLRFKWVSSEGVGIYFRLVYIIYIIGRYALLK
jgi:hypothetical protein